MSAHHFFLDNPIMNMAFTLLKTGVSLSFYVELTELIHHPQTDTQLHPGRAPVICDF